MKSFRWTFVFAVIVAGLVLFTVSDYNKSLKEEEQKEQDLTLVKITPEETARIELISKNNSIVLERTDDNWQLISPVQDRADEQAVQSLLSAMQSEKIEEVVVSGSDVSLPTYGLDKPVNRVKLKASDGREQEVKIGAVKAYDSNLYAQVGNEDRVLLVSANWDLHLSKTVRNFRNKLLYRSSESAPIEKIEIEASERGYPGLISLVKKDDNWVMTRGGFESYPIAKSAVEAYIDQVKAVRGLDFLEDDKRGSSSKYGLNRPSVRVRFIGEKKKTLFELSLSPLADEKGNMAAMSSDAPAIFSLYKSVAETLTKTPDHFYDRKYPFQFSPDGITRVTVRTPEIETELVKKDGAWVQAAPSEKSEVDSSAVQSMIEKFGRLEAVRVLKGYQKDRAPSFEAESKVTLAKDDGTTVFEIAWGKFQVEKAAGAESESRYHPVRTSAANWVVSVPEAELSGLNLVTLVKSSQAVAEKATPEPNSPAVSSDTKEASAQ